MIEGMVVLGPANAQDEGEDDDEDGEPHVGALPPTSRDSLVPQSMALT